MNSQREVRDSKNMIIGWCRDYDDKILAMHIRKGLVGYYVKNSNLTFDAKTGKVFSFGDSTATLIYNAEK